MIQSIREKPKLIPARHAMTLVELLVVLAIVSALAALVLPAVKGMIADRKTSQTAIVVKNYIESARARAIGKNRSVAVVLERLSGRAEDTNNDGIVDMSDATNPNSPATPRFNSATASPIPVGSRTTYPLDTNFLPYNTCIKLSMAEEPLPVTEKSIPITTMMARSPIDGLLPTIPNSYDPVVPLVDPDQASIPEVRIFQVTASNGLNAAALLGEYLIAGNEVSFGESPIRFTITSPTTRASHDKYSVNNPTTIWFSVMNERGLDGLGEMAMHPYVDAIAGIASAKFKIFQKPKPIYTQAIQLPKGTCIDLSLSGFANDRSATSGLSDYRVRFASDWVLTGAAGIPTPEELRPIYLVFSPDGSFSRVFANQKMGPQSVRIDSVEDVFLHIGRIDQVVMPLDPNNASVGRNVAGLTAAVASGTKMNLTDASSYVLRLSPKSGAITAAPISFFAPAATDSLGDIIGKSRLATYNSTITGQ
ncbi:MAG: type II secretion system protein [Planctomycetota bacterium]|nr:type II secretion system protein [Planctomycetota bacterium]